MPNHVFVNPAWTVPSDSVKFWQHFLAWVFRTIFTHGTQFATLASMLLPTEGALKKIKEKGLLKASLPSPLHHHGPISTQLKGVTYSWSNTELLFSPSKNLLLWRWSQLTQEEGEGRETRGKKGYYLVWLKTLQKSGQKVFQRYLISVESLFQNVKDLKNDTT